MREETTPQAESLEEEAQGQDPMEHAAQVLGSIYSPAMTGTEAREFIDRHQIHPLLEEAMGADAARVNLPKLMANEGYLCQRINGRPYWLACPVV